MTKDDDTELNAAFAQIKSEPVVVRDSLFDRIMLDADNVLAQREDVVEAVDARPRQSLSAILLDAIGGWPSFSGLAAATVAGLWIGISPPETLNNLSAAIWGSTIEVPLLESDALFGLEG